MVMTARVLLGWVDPADLERPGRTPGPRTAKRMHQRRCRPDRLRRARHDPGRKAERHTEPERRLHRDRPERRQAGPGAVRGVPEGEMCPTFWAASLPGIYVTAKRAAMGRPPAGASPGRPAKVIVPDGLADEVEHQLAQRVVGWSRWRARPAGGGGFREGEGLARPGPRQGLLQARMVGTRQVQALGRPKAAASSGFSRPGNWVWHSAAKV